MTDSFPGRRWSLLGASLIACVMLACVAVRWWLPEFKVWAGNGASAAWACLCTLAFVFVFSVRDWLYAMPAAARALLPILAVLLAVAQLQGDSEATHPLAHWHMFSSASPTHRYAYRELEGVTRSGAVVRLVPGDLFPSVARHLLFTRLQEVLAALALPQSARPLSPENARRIDETITAFVARYDRLHPEDPVVRVRAKRVFVDLDANAVTYTIRPVVVHEREVAAR